jgi:hypothetical protein
MMNSLSCFNLIFKIFYKFELDCVYILINTTLIIILIIKVVDEW